MDDANSPEESAENASEEQEVAQEGTVAVEGKTVGYVIMNPDFHKERKRAVRITGPSSAHEFITRKPGT